MAREDNARNKFSKVAFPAVVYLVNDGLPLGFNYIVIDGCQGYLPPWQWPSEHRLRRGGIFDSEGYHHEFDGEIGYRPPVSVLTQLANALTLGSTLFVTLYGRCSYGPGIVMQRRLSTEEFRSKVRDVIFERDETTSEFRDYVDITDRKLALSQGYQQMVEVVRWHILTDGGAVELAPSNRYYGRTPAV